MFPASRLVELGKVFHIQHYPMSVSEYCQKVILSLRKTERQRNTQGCWFKDIFSRLHTVVTLNLTKSAHRWMHRHLIKH